MRSFSFSFNGKQSRKNLQPRNFRLNVITMLVTDREICTVNVYGLFLGNNMKVRMLVNILPAIHLIFNILRWFSLSFLLPLGFAIYHGENVFVFIIPAVIVGLLGWIGEYFTRSEVHITLREGFFVVAVAWLAIAAFGAIPYLFNNISFINALFEAMSGFTTTGATILTDIEGQTRSLLMWRQFSQWLGGMGIIVLAVAILPKLAVGGRQLMEAEAPGPQVDKLTPHLVHTAQLLWKVYVGLTLAEFILLGISGLSFFDSLAHAFSTMATGGFSPRAQSLAAFGPIAQWIVIVFMMLAGTSFTLLFRALTGRFGEIRRNAEFKVYLSVIAISGLALTLLLNSGSIEERLRHGFFQAISIMTGTGYANADFNEWANIMKLILLLLMFFGGCAGSTTGSIKVIRSLLSFKFILRELRKLVHPSAVIPIRLGQKTVTESALTGVMAFIILYITTFTIGSILVMLDAHLHGHPLSLFEGLSAVAATLGNVGPAFGAAGPMGSYEGFPDTTKALMILLMWAGRLELFPAIVLLTRSYWNR
jgi:trk system potassium uptake protein TrkH